MNTPLPPTSKRHTKLLVVHDHELTRLGLRGLIAQQEDMEICGETANDAAARRLIRETSPDIVLVDIRIHEGQGLELLKWIHQCCPGSRSIVLTAAEEGLYAIRALRAGARGYVSEQAPADMILAAIRQVSEGGLAFSDDVKQRILQLVSDNNSSPMSLALMDRLSDRELEVFRLIGLGYSTDQIASGLHLSANTIGTYRERLKKKLQVSGATELTRAALQWLLERE